MTNARQKLLKYIWFLLIATPLISAAGWTAYPAMRMLVSINQIPPVYYPEDESENRTLIKQIKRDIQRHFRKSGIYVPTEDILTISDKSGTSEELMAKVCGSGRLFIWAPLRLRFPFVGERIKHNRLPPHPTPP